MITKGVKKVVAISILIIVFIVVLVLDLIIKFKSFKKDEERKNAVTTKQLETLQAGKEYYENMTFKVVDEDD